MAGAGPGVCESRGRGDVVREGMGPNRVMLLVVRRGAVGRRSSGGAQAGSSAGAACTGTSPWGERAFTPRGGAQLERSGAGRQGAVRRRDGTGGCRAETHLRERSAVEPGP